MILRWIVAFIPLLHSVHLGRQQNVVLENLKLPDGYLAVTINKGDVKKVSILPVHANGQKAGNATALVEGFVNPSSIGYLPKQHALIISDPGRDEGEVLLQKLIFNEKGNVVADGGPVSLLVGKKIFSIAVDKRSGDVFLGEEGNGSVLRVPVETVQMILDHRADVDKEADVDFVTQAQIVERSFSSEQKKMAKPEVFELYSLESSAVLEKTTAPHVAVTGNSQKVYVTSEDGILDGTVDVARKSKLENVADEPGVRSMVDTPRVMYFTEDGFVKAVSHGGFARPQVVTEKLSTPHGIAYDDENTVYVVDTSTPGPFDSTGAIFSFPCGSEDGDGDYTPDKVTELDGAFDVVFIPSDSIAKPSADHLQLFDWMFNWIEI